MYQAIRLTVAAILAGLALQTQAATAQFLDKKVLTLTAAQKIVEAAKAEAERYQLAGVIAVVDDGGWPIVLLRMDNAPYVASVELAPGKARTAALFRKPTEALENAINDGRIAAVTAHDFVEMKGACRSWSRGRSSEVSARASTHRITTSRSHAPGLPRLPASAFLLDR